MAYLLLAVVTAIVHALFIVFVVTGGWMFSRWVGVLWLHATCAIYAVTITLVGWRCPLTDLEIWLRQQGGQMVEWREYMHHYLWSHIGWSGSEWFITLILVALILLFNTRAYYHAITMS